LWWRVVWTLHVEGFHEARLPRSEVERDAVYLKQIVELAKGIVFAET